MRKSMVEAAALAALLIGAALACGQPNGPPAAPDKEKPKEQPAKSKLEEMIEKALKDNPDVRLAAAKAAEAEAELSRARLLAVQKVAAAYQAVEAQKAAVESATAELKEVTTAYNAGKADPATVRATEQKLIDAKAKLAQAEAELPYLLGKEPDGVRLEAVEALRAISPSADADADSAKRRVDRLRRYYLDLYGRLPTPEELSPKAAVQGPAADRIRAALDKPFTYEGKDIVLSEVLKKMNEAFQEASQGLVIKDAAHDVTDGNGTTVHFDRMPLGAALEWVEDTLPNCRFYVRDYGLVFAARDQAPPGAPSLADFWKGAKPDDKDAGAKTPFFIPPPVQVEGRVTEVAKDGLVHVSVGSDAGLAKGNTLEVLRPVAAASRPMYITRIRIVEVSASDSVGKPMFQGNGYIQPGDVATSEFTGQAPAQALEGKVKEVDKDGRIRINMGKNAGLAKGDELLVTRSDPRGNQAGTLARLRVVEVGDGDAVAEMAAGGDAPDRVIKAGDHVHTMPKGK